MVLPPSARETWGTLRKKTSKNRFFHSIVQYTQRYFKHKQRRKAIAKNHSPVKALNQKISVLHFWPFLAKKGLFFGKLANWAEKFSLFAYQLLTFFP